MFGFCFLIYAYCYIAKLSSAPALFSTTIRNYAVMLLFHTTSLFNILSCQDVMVTVDLYNEKEKEMK
jgi:L-rhamnose mutarotase